jgi:hypothetical protein
MPNNTSIMISFAACFAFYLSTTGSTGSMSLAPSIRKLIEESADVLERLGTNPPLRNGAAALYGRHLREVVGNFVPGTDYGQGQGQTPYPVLQTEQPLMGYQDQPGLPQLEMSELLIFSSMSDDQINEAINNAGKELDMYIPSLQMEDQTALDWLVCPLLVSTVPHSSG